MERYWIAIGLLGQGLFTGRFLVQWLASEKEGKSVIPELFWHLSLSGGTILLVYALWRRDPVFILGQATGIIVYTRNLILIRQEKYRCLPVTVQSTPTMRDN